MFSQVCWECLLCKGLIAALLGKPSPVRFLQYWGLHHGLTSIPWKRGEMWKINPLFWRSGRHLEVSDISIQSRVCQWKSLILDSTPPPPTPDCLICYILNIQDRKLFNICCILSQSNVFASFSWCTALRTHSESISSSYVDLIFVRYNNICGSSNTRMKMNYTQ